MTILPIDRHRSASVTTRSRNWRAALAMIPGGTALPLASWRVRHRAIQTILMLHLPGLGVFALVQGVGVPHALVELLPVLLCLGISSMRWLSCRYRAVAASVGLIACSAILVHLSGGYIEMHFHFFVMVIVISLYEDWLPLLVAIGFVVLHHGGLGVLDSGAVYKNADAIAHPWRWALIHAVFVLGASAASVVSWRLNERARSRTELILHSVGEGICGVDTAGIVTFGNDTAERMLGLPSGELEGRHLHDLLHAGDRSHGAADCALIRESAPGPGFKESRIMRTDTVAMPIEYSFTPIKSRDHVEGGVVVFRDITQRKDYEERLAHQAMYDDLTGLPNRRLFGDRIRQAVARGQLRNESVAVLYVDIDRFKLVNDSLGHQAGDTLLIALGRELRASVRGSDTVARLGGDEFAILLEGVGEADATRIAGKLFDNLRRPIPLEGRDLAIAVSIGIALSSPERNSTAPDELLRDADVAMYQAKKAGGSRAVVFETWMNEDQLHRLEIEGDLRLAVTRSELLLEYQPEVNLATGELVGLEALVRWQHPRLGLLPPAQFIPIAEQSGHIIELGAWVIREACRQFRTWQDEFPAAENLVVSINLSLLQLRDPNIVELVRSEIERWKLKPDSLKFELTETEMMDDTAVTIAVLHQLKALGVRLAIDDFGTGYSSLSYLQQFPVRTLKIDRSFLVSLGEKDTLSILRAIMALARALDVDVTAEGIETEDQREAMTELGCERGQGFLFARPMAPEALLPLLRELGAGETLAA